MCNAISTSLLPSYEFRSVEIVLTSPKQDRSWFARNNQNQISITWLYTSSKNQIKLDLCANRIQSQYQLSRIKCFFIQTIFLLSMIRSIHRHLKYTNTYRHKWAHWFFQAINQSLHYELSWAQTPRAHLLFQIWAVALKTISLEFTIHFKYELSWAQTNQAHLSFQMWAILISPIALKTISLKFIFHFKYELSWDRTSISNVSCLSSK